MMSKAVRYINRAGSLLGFPELVRERGQNLSKLLHEVGLSAAVLHDHDLYLPYVTLTRLYARAAKVCGDEHFGLHLGSRQGLELIGALASLLCLQSTVADALAVLRKNLGFHARGLMMGAETGDSGVRLTLTLPFEQETDCTQMMAKSMATTALTFAQLHAGRVPPLEVTFTFAAPADSQPYEAYFGCPVRFGAPANSVLYPCEVFALPVAVSPELRSRITQRWRGDWQKAASAATVSQQVERAIVALVPTGDYSLEIVARVLMLHPRSLQQQLQREDTQYGAILQKARQNLACQHLELSDIELTRLALDLGFSELSVFSRAFKKWFGVSPSVWRSERLSHAAPALGSGMARS